MFKDDKVQIVALAVKSLIKNLEFPPTIADVKKEMEKIVDVATDKPSAIDEWNLIRKALGNSIYHAEENFETLPPIAKKFVGSPKQLRDWATSTDFNDGVIRGQFLKQYEVLEKREKYRATMPPEIAKLIEKTGLKMLEGGEAE